MAGSVELSWGQAAKDLPERWPKASDGTPEKPALLTHLGDWNYEAELLTEKLRAYGIPVLRSFGDYGSLGKIVLGYSGSGVDLYVPAPVLEDAQNLLKPVDDADFNTNPSESF